MAEIIDDKKKKEYAVSLNQNIVNGLGMLGGYDAYQLMPNGAKVAPVKQKTNSYTASNSKILYMFQGGGNGAYDEYYPIQSIGFDSGEEVILSGPNSDPATDSKYIIMTGSKSLQTVRWDQKTDDC